MGGGPVGSGGGGGGGSVIWGRVTIGCGVGMVGCGVKEKGGVCPV